MMFQKAHEVYPPPLVSGKTEKQEIKKKQSTSTFFFPQSYMSCVAKFSV